MVATPSTYNPIAAIYTTGLNVQGIIKNTSVLADMFPETKPRRQCARRKAPTYSDSSNPSKVSVAMNLIPRLPESTDT